MGSKKETHIYEPTETRIVSIFRKVYKRNQNPKKQKEPNHPL